MEMLKKSIENKIKKLYPLFIALNKKNVKAKVLKNKIKKL